MYLECNSIFSDQDYAVFFRFYRSIMMFVVQMAFIRVIPFEIHQINFDKTIIHVQIKWSSTSSAIPLNKCSSFEQVHV